MRICVIGSGYVGLVNAACLADSGNTVVAVDTNAEKVASLSRGECPIFEPGLEELLRTNLSAGRLRFTTNAPAAIADAKVIFIAVGTPPRPDGGADLTMFEAAATEIGDHLSAGAVVVIKSTVPVGTGRHAQGLIAARTQRPFQVVNNPEFLKEGAAVEDFLRPDRVVIGASDSEAAEIVAELHRPFVRNNRPILVMSRESAEMTKYAANAYLATRISFINEVAEICERLGVDIDEVRRGMGTDARIGFQYLYPGLGYGGSCFPKDVQAMVDFARACGAQSELTAAVHARNLRQRELMIEKIRERLGPDLTGRTIAVWGLAFKPQTDDIREAPAISIIERLLESGARVAAHDPHALDAARAVFGERVSLHFDAYQALRGADALLTATEWMEYRSPDFDRIRAELKQALIFDGRNIYDARQMKRYGFEYHSVGRPAMKPA